MSDIDETLALQRPADQTSAFANLPNRDLKVPDHKPVKPLPEPLAPRSDQPEQDSEVDIDSSGQIVYTERTEETASRSFNAFTVWVLPGSDAFAGDLTRILSEDEHRSRTIILNSGTAPVILGTQTQCSSGSGFLLPAGAQLEPEVQESIYACQPLGSGSSPAVSLSIWVESN